MGDIMASVAGWVRDNGYEFEGPAFNILSQYAFLTKQQCNTKPEFRVKENLLFLKIFLRTVGKGERKGHAAACATCPKTYFLLTE